MAKKQKKHTQAVKTTHPKNKHENQPAQSKQVKQVKKERGWLLATAIIIITLHGILATYLISTYPSNQVYVPRPYILPILIANAFIDVVAGIAMWFWKRWGVILFGIQRGHLSGDRAGVHRAANGYLLPVDPLRDPGLYNRVSKQAAIF